jgi:ABC-type transport system substrate-binding protein
MKFLILCLSAVLVFTACNSDKKKAGNGAKEKVFKYNLGQEPTTLNPLSSTDYYASIVQGYVVEGMAERDKETYEWKPLLAESWEKSKDGLSFTFNLRDGLKWQDGKPLTTEDIKFTFEAIMDPKNKYKTAHSKPYFENIKDCVAVSPKQVRFNVKKKYFGNFSVVAGMEILPKHIYESTEKENLKKLNKTILASGPYKVKQFKRGKFITLERNKQWWGNNVPSQKGQYNHDVILMRFIKDGVQAIQRLEKGDLDFISLSAEEFMKKTEGERWGKEVFKIKYQNKQPKGYNFIGWNLKNPMFTSKNVRKALVHLIDRQKMIDKFDFGLRVRATGPLYQQSMYADTSVKAIDYDPKKALELMRKEGWKDSDGDQILDKVIDGKKTNFSFTILEPNKEFAKYLVVFQEDAKKAGVEVNIKQIEWNTFIKLLDERKFEAVRLGWSGGSVDYDPKQIWHSASYGNKGSNFIGYSNKEVDKMIDKARETLDREKRIPLLKKFYRLVAEDVPYAFLFNSKFGFYGHTKRTKRHQDTYTYTVGTNHWWLEP